MRSETHSWSPSVRNKEKAHWKKSFKNRHSAKKRMSTENGAERKDGGEKAAQNLMRVWRETQGVKKRKCNKKKRSLS